MFPVIRPTREHAQWTGTKSVEWKKDLISAYDLVLIATNHASVNVPGIGGLVAADCRHAKCDGDDQDETGTGDESVITELASDRLAPLTAKRNRSLQLKELLRVWFLAELKSLRFLQSWAAVKYERLQLLIRLVSSSGSWGLD